MDDAVQIIMSATDAKQQFSVVQKASTWVQKASTALLVDTNWILPTMQVLWCKTLRTDAKGFEYVLSCIHRYKYKYNSTRTKSRLLAIHFKRLS